MLSMLDDSVQLLAGQEAREPARVGISVGDDVRHSIAPLNALCAREEILEQLVLAAKSHINVAASQTWRTSALRDTVESCDRFLCILHRHEFHVAVHRLGCGPLHDDVHSTAQLRRDEACVGA